MYDSIFTGPRDRVWTSLGMEGDILLSTTVKYLLGAHNGSVRIHGQACLTSKPMISTTHYKISSIQSVKEIIKSQNISSEEGHVTFRIINWGLLNIILAVTTQKLTLLISMSNFVLSILYIYSHSLFSCEAEYYLPGN